MNEKFSEKKDLLSYIEGLSDYSKDLVDGTLLNHAGLNIEQLSLIPEENKEQAQSLVEEGLVILQNTETRNLTPEENERVREIGKEIDKLF